MYKILGAMAIIGLLFSGCGTTPSPAPKQVVKTKNNGLKGTWYYKGQLLQLVQDGNSLLFINERGSQSQGYIKDSNTVVATGWGNLHGILSDNNNRINWTNNTWWVRDKQKSYK